MADNNMQHGYDWEEGQNVTASSNANYGPLQMTSGNTAGDVPDLGKYMRKNTKNYDEFKYFLEGIDVTDQNLDQMTPYIPGISRLYFHKTPYFMAKGFPELTDNFRSYFETGFRSVTGIGNLTAEGIDIEGGWANQKFSNISTVRDETETITVSLYEQTGSPVREFIETWMTGMRDPRSGVAHYHNQVLIPGDQADPENGKRTDEGVVYCERNHTGEFIYVDLDPTAQYIEYACLLAHVWPRSLPRDHLNYTSGSRDAAQLDLEFAVTKYEGKYVNDIAAYYIAHSNLQYNYLEFNPYKSKDSLDNYMQYTTAHAGTKNGVFEEYGPVATEQASS